MALKTCTRPAGSVGAYAKVEIRLSQDTIVTAGGANYLALPIEITAAADGSYSVQLQATNDLTPNGTYYSVSEYGGITDSTYFVRVPPTAGPFVLTSIQVNVPPAPAPVGAAHVASLLVDGAATVSGALEAGSSTTIAMLGSKQTFTGVNLFSPTNPATTLNGAIDNAVTTIVVASASGFANPGPFTILIDFEKMRVTAGYGTTTRTATRAPAQTQAAPHSPPPALAPGPPHPLRPRPAPPSSLTPP